MLHFFGAHCSFEQALVTVVGRQIRQQRSRERRAINIKSDSKLEQAPAGQARIVPSFCNSCLMRDINILVDMSNLFSVSCTTQLETHLLCIFPLEIDSINKYPYSKICSFRYFVIHSCKSHLGTFIINATSLPELKGLMVGFQANFGRARILKASFPETHPNLIIQWIYPTVQHYTSLKIVCALHIIMGRISKAYFFDYFCRQ